MTRHPTDLRERRPARVEMRKPGFLIPAPGAPSIKCLIVGVSDKDICLDVGDLPVPDTFAVAFTAGGQVRRVCTLVWREGDRIGARFVSAKELRMRFEPIPEPSSPQPRSEIT